MSAFRTVLAVLAMGAISQAAKPAATTLLTSSQQVRGRVGIVCNFEKDRAKVQALANTMEKGSEIVVIDTRTAKDIKAACKALKAQEVDSVLVMPWDPDFSLQGVEGKEISSHLTITENTVVYL